MNNSTNFFLFLAFLLLCLRTEANFNDLGSGTLLLDFKSSDSTQWVAPGLEADIDIRVTGPILRATVTQTFYNPCGEWANATYVFPLPETAAVDHMKLIIGERVIEGQIKEKQEAGKIYEAAKKQGKKASLVSQQRSNLFTTNVANIPPGEKIRVSIQYQHPVDRDGDIYSLRFPMTITPRYIPGTPIIGDSENPDTGDGLSPNTTAVADAAKITPPWGKQGENRHPTRITVNLRPGFAVADFASINHPVTRTTGGRGETVITLSPQDHPANSDFILQWQPAVKGAPQTALFTEKSGDNRYSLLMLTPPAAELSAPVLPREVIFVIDTSGSMGGEPIRQAKRALVWAIDRLRPEDSFNVIEFNSGSWSLFDTAQPADPASLTRAKQFVGALQSRGGTEMLGAMDMALCASCGDGDKIRQVIFLTDGAIGNEDQLFRMISERLGSSRLFTVGIGSAPNSHFMRKAAETGRGTFTYIARIDQAGESMAKLFDTLESPLLTHINIESDGKVIDITPDPVPDIYAGKPLVLLLKGELPRTLRLSGRLGNTPWQHEVSARAFQAGAGIGVLWGRQKIDDLMDRYRFSYDNQAKASLKHAITDLALEHHLVSAFTSLVAVDITPARESGAPSTDHQIANNSPHGTHFGLTNTATPAMKKLVAGLLLSLFAMLMIWWQNRVDSQSEAKQLAIIHLLKSDRR